MSIPSELIGSLPRTTDVLNAMASGDSTALAKAVDMAVRDTVERLEAAGSPVVTDGEQGKTNAWTYPLDGADNLAPDGAVIPYADGHQRQLPRLTAGPFRYATRADQYVRAAAKYAKVPVKQAVASPAMLSLLYPADGIAGYSREEFLYDLLDEAEKEIRACFDAGARSVQLGFEEGRLALKLDPSGGVLRQFVDLDNRLLDRFSADERAKIGVHTSPGADQGSTHSLDVDYAELLPQLFRLNVGTFYLQLASEAEPERVLRAVADHLPPEARAFIGVIDPLDPRVETAEQVRDRVLAAARHLPVDRLGTCDDAGFATFADDRSTSRDTAFAKISARIQGTALAATALGVG